MNSWVLSLSRLPVQSYLRLIASGEVDETMREALEDYVRLQKKRLGVPEKEVAAN